MEKTLYDICLQYQCNVRENDSNISAVNALLTLLEIQKKNTVSFYKDAFYILLSIAGIVHLKSLNIDSSGGLTYQQRYLKLLIPILQIADGPLSRRGFDVASLIEKTGHCFNSSDIGIILSNQYDEVNKRNQLSNTVIQSLIDHASYTNIERQLSVPATLKVQYIGVVSSKTVTPSRRTGSFELLYLYGEHIYDIPAPQQIYFSEELIVKRDATQFIISRNPSFRSVPQGFYGKKIRGVHAVIGKNGAGKSSVFEMISNCSIFGPTGYPEGLGDYLLLYKVGDEYFYANKTNKKVITADASLNIQDLSIESEVRICKISNVFDIYHFSAEDQKVSQVIDLTTQSIMHDIKTQEQQEELRIRNYQKIIQKGLSSGQLDEFDNKVVADLSQLSSGERARLTLFARILYVFMIHKDLKGKLYQEDVVPNYIFMFDEAELYFHPAWQRKIIADLCRFFERIDKEMAPNVVANITILLSSNSPFYMSDLPSYAIHRLGSHIDNNSNTFGQNIYSLLKDRFFMDEGVIGSFAQNKINHALQLLADYDSKETAEGQIKIAKTQPLTDDELKEIDYLIDIMGDSVLKEIMQEQPRYQDKKWKKD